MSQFKIEKSVPIPPRSRASKYPFEQMEKGDSFVIPAADNKSLTSARSSVYAAATKQKVKVATRVDDKGLRVWRVSA